MGAPASRCLQKARSGRALMNSCSVWAIITLRSPFLWLRRPSWTACPSASASRTRTLITMCRCWCHRGLIARIEEVEAVGVGNQESGLGQYAQRVMERADVLGRISEEPDRLTRRFATAPMQHATDTVAGW